MFQKIIICAILCGLAVTAQAQKVDIIMATLAPADSAWFKVMENMGAEWKRISGGNVTLSIRAGGVVGDEPDSVRRLRMGSIQAAALSGAGLSDVDQGVAALQIPMMFDSYEELDYVRDRIGPKLQKRIEDKGFVLLNWGDAGWVQFFSNKPLTKLDDLRKLRLFTWAGDPTAEEIWKTAGFHVVPLAATDIVQQLETHGIDAVPDYCAVRRNHGPLQTGELHVGCEMGAAGGSDHRFQGHLGEDPGGATRSAAGRSPQIRRGSEERYSRARHAGHLDHDGRAAGPQSQQADHHDARHRGSGRLAQADRGHLSQDEGQDGAGGFVRRSSAAAGRVPGSRPER